MRKLAVFNIIALLVLIIFYYIFLDQLVTLLLVDDVEISIFTIITRASTDNRNTIINFPIFLLIFALIGNVYLYGKYGDEY